MYAPCQENRKHDLLNWLSGIQIPTDADWLLVGDFNLNRSIAGRNKPGGNLQEILSFNDAISELGLVEILPRVTYKTNPY